MRKVRRKVEEELSLEEGALDAHKQFLRILIDQARAISPSDLPPTPSPVSARS